MKERPILFSAPMVRAILAGSKSQTRRVVKPRRDRDLGCPLAPNELAGEVNAGQYRNAYAAPGDRLWVRETFAKVDGQTQPWIETDYRATYTHGDRLGDSLGVRKRWTPAIHMPRAASRIDLEVVDVRVERLQAISEDDAIAEGIERRGPGWRWYSDPTAFTSQPVTSYRDLWETINGPGSWDANPWVWAVEFRRIRP